MGEVTVCLALNHILIGYVETDRATLAVDFGLDFTIQKFLAFLERLYDLRFIEAGKPKERIHENTKRRVFDHDDIVSLACKIPLYTGSGQKEI